MSMKGLETKWKGLVESAVESAEKFVLIAKEAKSVRESVEKEIADMNDMFGKLESAIERKRTENTELINSVRNTQEKHRQILDNAIELEKSKKELAATQLAFAHESEVLKEKISQANIRLSNLEEREQGIAKREKELSDRLARFEDLKKSA